MHDLVQLIDKIISYNPQSNTELITKAYNFSKQAHEGQYRKSKEPYFTHLAEVAYILAENKADDVTICTGLLHDTVEDTDVSYDDLKSEFSEQIATFVDGVTKLNEYSFDLSITGSKFAENFRKLIIAASKDIRVMLVKIADRLHNMRTLEYMRGDRQKAIAQETLDIYALIADRLGLNNIKTELENLSFKYLDYNAWVEVSTQIDYLVNEHKHVFEDFKDNISTIINNKSIKHELKYRIKSPYSTWRKMSNKKILFKELWDLVAYRVIVDSIEDCYLVLGLLHNCGYKVSLSRFRDFIASPKANGYQSLHTGLYGPNAEHLEVQIRTKAMDDVAENGIASHWNYKQNHIAKPKDYLAVRELLKSIENESDPEELIRNAKSSIFKPTVFCHTPKGHIISLPIDATVLDFAFAVHTEIGLHCNGAIIKNNITGVINQEVPANHVLDNYDEVHIIVDNNYVVPLHYSNFVKTGTAKSTIKRFHQRHKRLHYYTVGENLLVNAFKSINKEYSVDLIVPHLSKFACSEAKQLIEAVGRFEIPPLSIAKEVFPDIKDISEESSLFLIRKDGFAQHSPLSFYYQEKIQIAECCHPLPGERIVGISHKQIGLTVHNIKCKTLFRYEDSGDDLLGKKYSWVDLIWNDKVNFSLYRHKVSMHIKAIDTTGVLYDITKCIYESDINISRLEFIGTNKHILYMPHRKEQNITSFYITIEVVDIKQFINIRKQIQNMDHIVFVDRIYNI